MSQVIENSLNQAQNDVKTSISVGVYTIYDCVLKQFGAPISIPDSKVNDYFTLLVNDVQSPYYNHESDFILNRIGSFDPNTGEIDLHFVERICIIDSFIDNNKRNLQTLIKTLNYLPTGYFKMPAEQKEAIQVQINDAVKKYVEDYVVPDLDISSEKIKSLESIISDYEERLKIVGNK